MMAPDGKKVMTIWKGVEKMKRVSILVLVLSFVMVMFSACASNPTPASSPSSVTEVSQTEAPIPENMELTLYYGAQETQMKPILDAFQLKYPNITVHSYRAPSEELAATMNMELEAKNPRFDVVVVANSAIRSLEEQYQPFEQFTPDEVSALIPGLLDKNSIEVPIGQNFYVIEYNKNLVSESDVPKSWADLLDPKWKNKLAIADPASSTSIYGLIWYLTQYEKGSPYGWDYFTKLQEVNPNYIASHGTIDQMIAMGESSVGAQMMSVVTTSLQQNNPVGWVFPSDGMPAEVNIAAITKDSKNKDAAELFVNYLTSKEGQVLIGQNIYIPVRTDIDYTFSNGVKFSDITLVGRDVDWITANKEDIISRFQDIRG